MRIYKNFLLTRYNAFKVPVRAKFFAVIKSEGDLFRITNDKNLVNEKIYVLGDGTNTLFTRNFDGLIIKIALKGKKTIKEGSGYVILEVGAGENWHTLVKYALKNNWGGLENLSYIPGTVGAAPVQNIAAYGQNLEDVFHSLRAFNLKNGTFRNFTKKDCKFGYRESIFKKELKGQYVITKVNIKLSKSIHIDISYHSRYGSLEGVLSKFAKPPYTISDVSRAVIAIRKTKFPNWKKLGTAGSFFLNPVITKKELKFIENKAPGVQYYPVDKLTYPQPEDPAFNHSNYVKVAAGWLLDELGWRGKKIGNVGTSPNQALVVINYGNAGPGEIIKFTDKMREDFYKNYRIKLTPEVNII